MKKFVLIFMAVLAFTFSAQAQESQVGLYATASRSNVDQNINGYGGGFLGVYNIKGRAALFNDFAAVSDSSYPNQDGYTFTNKAQIRGNAFNVGKATVFASTGLIVRHQDFGLNNGEDTTYNPLVGGGVNFNNRFVATYDYSPKWGRGNNIQFHQLGAEGYIPVSNRANLIFGASAKAGRFNNGFFTSSNFSDGKVYVGFSFAGSRN